MCFIKKVEMQEEPIIYPCEHQCYYYNMQLLASNLHFSTQTQPINLPILPNLNFPTLMQQISTDIAITVERIKANNKSLCYFAEVPFFEKFRNYDKTKYLLNRQLYN